MAKKENKSLIIWAVICLIVGLVMGLFLTTVVTTGKAMQALSEKSTANLEEARTNLVLNLLKVNTIEKNGNGQLNILSQGQNGQILMEGNTGVTLGTNGTSFIMGGTPQENGISMASQNVNINTNAFRVSAHGETENALAIYPLGDSEGSKRITISVPLKYNVAMDVNYGADNYYACLTDEGTLFKSYSPCN
ncbi:MAG TPA: hypothetical protein PLK55_02735 [archaeon]|jgi:hypothetical protein|nr:hypothetical protein [archaeon]